MKAFSAFAVVLSLAIATPVTVRAETAPLIGYGHSPSEAVRRVFHIDQIRRINVVEPYAIVSARGEGPLFGPVSTTQFLLEHFDFGWQVVDSGGALCASERGITPAGARMLRAGMPKPGANSDGCDELDNGPSRSIAQVRKLMHGPVVPFVRVADNYAYSEDYGDGGGCGLFHFEAANGRWRFLAGCKGAMDPSAIEPFHIPLKTLCALQVGLPELKCPRRTQLRRLPASS